MTFAQLHRMCASKGLLATQAQFEAGQTITISDGTRRVCRITAEWSDPMSVVNATVMWLVQHEWITIEDIKSASTDTR